MMIYPLEDISGLSFVISILDQESVIDMAVAVGLGIDKRGLCFELFTDRSQGLI